MTKPLPVGDYKPQHGAYALRDNGDKSMTVADRAALLDIEADLETPEGVQDALKRRAAMGLLIMQRIETFIAEQVEAGVALADLAVLKAWPSFQNSSVRSIKAYSDMLSKDNGTPGVNEALREVQALLKEVDGATENE